MNVSYAVLISILLSMTQKIYRRSAIEESKRISRLLTEIWQLLVRPPKLQQTNGPLKLQR